MNQRLSTNALPLYVQIADELRRNIQSSVYRAGEQLPTESELSNRFGVNRHTLRRAIDILKNEGLLRVDRGRGTFVAAQPIALAINKRVRYNEALKAQGLKVAHQTLRVLEQGAEGAVGKNLELEEGDRVILLERLSVVDDAPISLSSSYFPSDHFPNLLQHCQHYQSISNMLDQEYNCDHIRLKTRISARAVLPRDARHLALPQHAPILLTESININQHGQKIEYGVTRFRGDLMELVFETNPAP